MFRTSIDDVMSWQPCKPYKRELVEKLFAGRDKLSAEEILDLDISAEDRLWVVLRTEFLPEKAMVCFAEDCVERLIHVWQEETQHSTIQLWIHWAIARAAAWGASTMLAGPMYVDQTRTAIRERWVSERNWQLERIRKYVLDIAGYITWCYKCRKYVVDGYCYKCGQVNPGPLSDDKISEEQQEILGVDYLNACIAITDFCWWIGRGIEEEEIRTGKEI